MFTEQVNSLDQLAHFPLVMGMKCMQPFSPLIPHSSNVVFTALVYIACIPAAVGDHIA